MINTYIAEAVGTFIFLVVVLTKKNEPVMIAIGLLVGILVATIASQGHLNPAITGMAWYQNNMSGDEAIGYIASQVIGAFLAVQWFNFYMNDTNKNFKLF